MNHTPLGKVFIFLVMWQRIQSQNSIVFPDTTCHFQYHLCQLVLLRNRSQNWVKIARDILKKSICGKKKQKQRGQTGTSKESLQNVIQVWLHERREGRPEDWVEWASHKSVAFRKISGHLTGVPLERLFQESHAASEVRPPYTTPWLSSVQGTGDLHPNWRHSWLWSNCTLFFVCFIFLFF